MKMLSVKKFFSLMIALTVLIAMFPTTTLNAFVPLRNGWHQEGGNIFWYVNNVRQFGWVELPHAIIYLRPTHNGAKAVGGIFATTGGEVHEFAADGSWIRRLDTPTIRNGWHIEGGNIFWYVNNVRQFGWVELPHAIIYLRPTHNGAKAVGGIFATTGGEVHEFAPDGSWIRRVDTQARNGWHIEGGNIFWYVNNVRQIGWVQLPHANIYLRPTHNGAKAVGGIFTTTGGEVHEFASDGSWIRRVDTPIRNGWHVEGGNIFWYVNNVRQVGWVHLPHASVYLRPTHNGAKAVGGIFATSGGEAHEFAADGAWIRRIV